MKISPHIHTHTHLQAHIHTTHTDTDVTTRQAYRSHTEQTHVYTDTNTPQTYAHVATCTHTHTHINIRYTHMVLYTITCLPKISERDSAEYSIISLLFLHCIHLACSCLYFAHAICHGWKSLPSPSPFGKILFLYASVQMSLPLGALHDLCMWPNLSSPYSHSTW